MIEGIRLYCPDCKKVYAVIEEMPKGKLIITTRCFDCDHEIEHVFYELHGFKKKRGYSDAEI